MPIHDWSRVPAGIFHHFHHSWIEEIQRALNAGLLPGDYYALAEQSAAGFGPDVLTLQGNRGGESAGDDDAPASRVPTGNGVLLAPPKIRLTAETDRTFYRRRQNRVAVRHVSGDRIIAFVEVVSPGNKNTRHGLRSFVEKAAELLDQSIHLLLLDLHPPGRRAPNGIHGVIWEYVTDEEYRAPADKPLTLVAYESALIVRAYIEPVAVGDPLIDMPLFLELGAHVLVPLEKTYQAAFAAVPHRWRRVLEAAS